jgi:mannose-6-phosphate isomerase-like protein (cupin superfamily)
MIMTSLRKNRTAFDLATLLKRREQSGKLYLEFLRVPAMSGGLYVLEAGASDPQQPHGEDEVYVVMAGKGKIRVGERVYPVAAGSVVFVEAQVEHRFFDIEERLEILVFFAPAEYSRRGEVV